MSDRLVEVNAVAFRRVFPWVHLFRAFRIAIDIRKVALAGLALVALAAGNLAFSRLPFAPPRASHGANWPWNERFGVAQPLELHNDFLRDPAGTLLRVGSDWKSPLKPVTTMVGPAQALIRPGRTWSDSAYAWTQLLWALCVWSLFAGAITRMAAVQFARDGKISMWSALRFSAENFFSYLSAPLLPISGIAALWVLCLLAGLFGRIPVVGPVFLGLFWWLALAVGLLMGLILIGMTLGWPLMYAAISTEGSDGYDGFSRAYGYVFSRPWHYLWCTVVSLAYGSVLIVFVSFAMTLAAYLAGWGISAGMGTGELSGLVSGAPEQVGGGALLGHPPTSDTQSWGTLTAGLWLHVAALLVAGFVSSYFWCTATIIYFLLRASDDATDLNEVYMPEEEEVDDLLPLVGVAASSQPVVERPAQDDLSGSGVKDPGSEDTELDIRIEKNPPDLAP